MPKFILLFIAMLIPGIQVHAAEPTPQTLVELNSSRIGVRQDNALLCFSLNEKTQWEACGKQPYLTLQDDAQLIASNARKISILRSDRVEHYDEKGRRIGRCTTALPADWKVQNTIISGGYFTECDISSMNDQTLNILDMEGKHTFRQDCSVPADSRIYRFGVKSKLAFVRRDTVEIHQLYRKKDNTTACQPLPKMRFTPAEPVDELFIFGNEIIGLRQGQTVRFMSFNDKTKQWGPATTASYYMNLDQAAARPLPDFQIPAPIRQKEISAPAALPAAQPFSVTSRPPATLDRVKPPAYPQNKSKIAITEQELAKLPVPAQSAALANNLAGIQTGPLEQRLAWLKQKVIADLVKVEGGSFVMGDFGQNFKQWDIWFLTNNEDTRHQHEVQLSSFYLSRYKTTYAEYDLYLDATGQPRSYMQDDQINRHPLIPAGIAWQEAKNYCLWLGTLTGQKFDLATEAQWEYAARSRGQFFTIATDNGHIELGRNLPYYEQIDLISPVVSPKRYPIGLFPPNPLGLFDMALNGSEWVNDWYAADAYQTSASRDPQGPATGDKKVVRNSDAKTPDVFGISLERKAVKSDRENWQPTARCAVNP